jgi:hypothetical protein
MKLYNYASTAIGASTSYEDAAELGSLYIYSINNIGCVQIGTASAISAYVYAWMENVELGTTTATQVAITTEGDEQDERETGPIEHVSMALANFSKALTKVPIISPYALASEMIFGKLSQVAAIFGWSRPNVIADPQYVKNNPFQNGALTITHDTSHRIVLDPKQELTVDPSYAGVQDDDMAIAHLCAVQSYLLSFSWAPTDAPMTPIYNIAVTPCANTYYQGTNYLCMQPTALSYAVTPFNYWRGVIKYKFEVVCSSYHRGKLGIFYEPNIYGYSLINANLKLNRQYFVIIDLQKITSIEICVDWAAPRAWQLTGPTGSKELYGGVLDASHLTEQTNGYIGIVPITELQSPDDSSVSVNVYISSDDMHVNFFNQSFMPTARHLATQGDESEMLDLSDLISSETYEMECFKGPGPLFVCVKHNSVYHNRYDVTKLCNDCTYVVNHDACIPDNCNAEQRDMEIESLVIADYMLKHGYAGISLIKTESYEIEVGDLGANEVPCININKSSAEDRCISIDFFGEEPRSFRSLLKRFQGTYDVSYDVATTGNSWITASFASIPMMNLVYGSPGTSDLFTYLRYAYLAVRGGVKKRIVLFGPAGTSPLDQVKVSLNNAGDFGDGSASSITTYYSAIPNGTVTFCPTSNGGIEFEVPFYSPNLFAFSFSSYLTGKAVPTKNTMVSTWVASYTVYIETHGAVSGGIGEESAAGEDFSFVRFQGAPFYSTT